MSIIFEDDTLDSLVYQHCLRVIREQVPKYIKETNMHDDALSNRVDTLDSQLQKTNIALGVTHSNKINNISQELCRLNDRIDNNYKILVDVLERIESNLKDKKD